MRFLIAITAVVVAALLIIPAVNRRVSGDAGRSLAQFTTPNIRPQIDAIESRATGNGSADENARLAALYVKQAKLTGDAAWFDKAETAAKASLKLQPSKNAVAKLALSETLEKRHLFAQSLAIAKEVVTEEPRNPEALAAYATVSLAVGDIDEATRAIDLASSATPTTAFLTLKALVLNARGRDIEADFYFREALRMEEVSNAPDASNTRAVYARFLITKGRYEEARRFVDEALQITPGQHLALSISGDLYLKKKQPEKAGKQFIEAFSASPQVSYLRKFARAKKLMNDQRGYDDGMREALALARKEIASGVHAHPLELGYVLIAGNDPAGWKEAIQAATDEQKVRRSVLPFVVLAQANEKAGHWEAANEAIDAVLRTGVRNPDYYLSAARIAKNLGNIERARFYFEAALAEDKNTTEAEEGLKVLRELPAPKTVTQK